MANYLNRATLTILVLFLIHQNVFAQAYERTYENTNALPSSDWKMYFNLGFNQPQGDFESRDLNDEASGLAKTGFQIGGGLNYFFSRNAFLIGEIKYFTNPIDEEAIIGLYNSNLPTGLSATITSGNWQNLNLMAGIGVKLEVDEEVSFYPQLKVGLASMVGPDYTITITNGIDTERQTQSEGVGSSIALALGGHFNIPIDNRANLILGAEYYQTTVDFEDAMFTVTYNGTILQEDPITYSQEVSFFNIFIGVSFDID